MEAVITVASDDVFAGHLPPRWLNWSCELLPSRCDFIGFHSCSSTSAPYPGAGIAVSPAPFVFTS